VKARHRITVVLGLFAGLAGAAPAAAQMPPATGAADKNSKLDSAFVALSARDGAAARAFAKQRGLDVQADAARVSVLAHDIAGARAALRSAGATAVRSAGGRVLEARVPSDALRSLAASSAVKYVAQVPYAEALATNGEGPAATGADDWHAAGVDGTGVKVAIVDLGFTGLAASKARGDIPATAIERSECAAGLNGNTDHGTAVAEIVHEMAPGAQLYLVCIDSPAALNAAKNFLVAQDVSIANFSVAFFNSARGDGSGGPGTPDGIVAAAASEGILWVNSAGNAAQTHYQGTFVDFTLPDTRHFHEFAPGDLGNGLVIGSGQTGCAFLRWDEWSGATTDFDLILTNPASTATVAQSVNAQTGTQPPVEGLCFNNTGATATFPLFIQRFSGTGTPRMDIFTNNGVFDTQYGIASSSILDPGAGTSVFTAGAICFQNDSLEPYSSQGPTIDGRIKPDIAGQDAVTSGVYGAFSTCGSSGFTGTSAASPHTAGAAALVKEANPGATSAQLRSFLESRAGALGPAGKDNQFGSGKLLLGAPGVAPLVTTGVAAAVTSGDATLAGVVNPGGFETAYRFEFGPTTAYGRQTTVASAGAGAVARAVAAPISGLSPSTTYHYRLVGASVFGTANGSDATFTTPAAPVLIPPPANAGQQGVLGTTGSSGSTGAAAQPRPAATKPLVTCKIKGKKVTCTVKLSKAKRATLKLTRGGKVFARAAGPPGRGGRLKVRTLRRPAHGRYKLSVAVTDRRGKVHRLSSSIML